MRLVFAGVDPRPVVYAVDVCTGLAGGGRQMSITILQWGILRLWCGAVDVAELDT